MVLAQILFTVLAFSSIEVVANPIRQQIDPFVMTFWRFFLGSILLFPIVFWQTREKGMAKRFSKADWLTLSWLGALNIIFAMGAHAVSIKHVKASTAAMLVAANPLATNFFAWLLLKEKLPANRLIALGLGLIGVCLIALRPVTGQDTIFGMAAGVIGMAGFALYTVLSKDIVQRLGSLQVTAFSFLLGVLIDLPILLISGVPLRPAADLWPRLLVLGFFVSGMGYLTFFRVLAVLPAGKTSLLFFLKPPVAILLAWILLSETPTTSALVGSTIIMTGIALDVFGRQSGLSERLPVK